MRKKIAGMCLILICIQNVGWVIKGRQSPPDAEAERPTDEGTQGDAGDGGKSQGGPGRAWGGS